jgi:hypothetical protein
MPSHRRPLTEPTPLEIATLAARFIPPLDFSSIGTRESWHPLLLKSALGELTTGKGRNNSEGYKCPEGWETPFEVIASEAVKRARVLLDAAAGKTRQAVLDHRQAGVDAQSQLRERLAAERAMRISDFSRLARGRDSIPLEEVLKFALPRMYSPRAENAWALLREWLAEDRRAFRRRNDLPEIPVTFSDVASDEQKASAVDSMSHAGSPACIVLPHSPGYLVGEGEFPPLVMELRAFKLRRGEALRKKEERRDTKPRGGNRANRTLAALLTRKDSTKLDRAARKVKNPRPGA